MTAEPTDPRTDVQKTLWAILTDPFADTWHNMKAAFRVASHIPDDRDHDLWTARCCPGAEPLWTPDELLAGRPLRDWAAWELTQWSRRELRQFIIEEYVPALNASVAADDLYRRYFLWQARHGWDLSPLSEAEFADEISAWFRSQQLAEQSCGGQDLDAAPEDAVCP
jgi:hypothetical protein